jgi:hypothetical protein
VTVTVTGACPQAEPPVFKGWSVVDLRGVRFFGEIPPDDLWYWDAFIVIAFNLVIISVVRDLDFRNVSLPIAFANVIALVSYLAFPIVGFYLTIRGLGVREFDLRNIYLATVLAIFIAFVGYCGEGGSVALVHSFIVIVRILNIRILRLRVLNKGLVPVASCYAKVLASSCDAWVPVGGRCNWGLVSCRCEGILAASCCDRVPASI